MANVNSFTETVQQLVNQVNIALEALVKLNESLTTKDDTVTLSIKTEDLITGDPSVVNYSIPSYNTVLNKVNSLAQTMDSFVKGEGVVLLNDGTYRKVITTPVAVSPSKITNVTIPTKFYTRSNWFFESLMHPQLTVAFDLKDKIDDRSDRVVVKRIIVDNATDEDTQWFLDNFTDVNRTYYETITFLTEQGKRYWEDEEIQNLPLFTEPFTGTFVITDIRTIDGKQWYYLDTFYYAKTTDEILLRNLQLSVDDKLRYGNSIWKIDEINLAEKRVHIIPLVGMDHPSLNKTFEIYTEPFSNKILEIPVGINECNIIFLKGVNDDFNIISDEWSYGIPFWTNNLTLKGNSTMTFEQYYNTYVYDFGRQLEGQVKEKFIPAYYGVEPDPPVIQ